MEQEPNSPEYYLLQVHIAASRLGRLATKYTEMTGEVLSFEIRSDVTTTEVKVNAEV